MQYRDKSVNHPASSDINSLIVTDYGRALNEHMDVEIL